MVSDTTTISTIISRLTNPKSPFGHLFYEHVDEESGLYCFWLRGVCLYIGESDNLRRRLKEHCESEDNPILVEYFKTYSGEIMVAVTYEHGASKPYLRRLESYAVTKMKPIANRTGVKR